MKTPFDQFSVDLEGFLGSTPPGGDPITVIAVALVKDPRQTVSVPVTAAQLDHMGLVLLHGVGRTRCAGCGTVSPAGAPFKGDPPDNWKCGGCAAAA